MSTFLARLAGRKPLITYHCDLQMPPVWYGKIVDRLTFWDNLVAGKLADTDRRVHAGFRRAFAVSVALLG